MARETRFGSFYSDIPHTTWNGLPRQDGSSNGFTPEFRFSDEDFAIGRNDRMILGLLTSDLIGHQQKVAVADRLFHAVFKSEDGKIDQTRAGNFLRVALELDSGDESLRFARENIDNNFSSAVLDRIKEQCVQERWKIDNAQAALEAYTRYMTLEKRYGSEKAAQIKRHLVKEMIVGREFEIQCDWLTKQEAQENRTIINLGGEGHEAAQTSLREAVVGEAEKLGVNLRGYWYYRQRVASLGDPIKGFRTKKDIMREISRKGYSGTELPVGGHAFDENGEIGTHRNVANVGKGLMAAVGAAWIMRQTEIEAEGITYSTSQRSDAYREIQAQNPIDVMVAGFGEGAWPDLLPAVKYAGIMHAPVIFACENNGVEIGTNAKETMVNPHVWNEGYTSNIPGVFVRATDIDGMIAASQFAVFRAANDGGATILEFETVRGQPHSAHHGDNRIPAIIRKVQGILNHTKENLQNSQTKAAITQFVDEGIYRPSRDDRIFDLKDRILEFTQLHRDELDQGTEHILSEIAHGIIDPNEEVLKRFITDGLITEEEIDTWRKESFSEMRALAEEVRAEALPTPQTVGQHIRAPYPTIIIKGKKYTDDIPGKDQERVKVEDSDEIVTMRGSEAQSEVLRRLLEQNPGFYIAGIDVHIGEEVKKEGGSYKIVPKGAYFNQTNVDSAVGHLPGRRVALPIAENWNVGLYSGAAIQPKSLVQYDFDIQTALLRGDITPNQVNPRFMLRRFFLEGEYGEYQLQAFENMWVHGGKYQLSDGELVMPLFITFPVGMTGGGGAMHSHVTEAQLFTLPEGIELYTISNMKALRGIINTLGRFGLNPVSLVIDRSLYNRTETWRRGTEFFRPGDDEVTIIGAQKPRTDLEVVTWGPMTKVVKQAAEKAILDIGGQFSIAVLDKISWRPFGEDDLLRLWKNGSGNLVITTEDFSSRSLAGHLLNKMFNSEKLAPFVYDRMRQGKNISYFASKDSSHPYCDEILMNAQRPGVDALTKAFGSILQDELRRSLLAL